MNNNITYPIAYNNITNQLVEIQNVTKDNKENLICNECKDNFVAVINHQTPHFRHKPDSNCIGSLESYIHWVSKEIFKTIQEIEIPELTIDELPEKQRQKFQKMYNEILDQNIHDTLRSRFRKSFKNNLTESKRIKIYNIEIEKQYKTPIGDIRVDIVSNFQNKEIFIEPFFTNSIDKTKKAKLELLETSTLSINLKKFIEYYNSNYSIQILKDYLISKESKKWAFLSNKTYDKCIKDYKEYLNTEIKKNEELINSHTIKLEEFSSLMLQRNKLEINLNQIQNKISELNIKLRELGEEVGIPYEDWS
ncbi:hypothetical protein [Pontimicrobium sp. IMCC45349]|uniref:hypothetical protein n=1 Tax=Pontimicrobium sp. IMCC45349 TaxID=3391574 RepID=UPI0039A0C83E